MCGIAGMVSTTHNSRNLVGRMVDALQHRGPDGNDIVSFASCTLGHTRLSIIDIDGGAQPMMNHKGDVALTFNGEIYGFRKLKAQLPYEYKTASDTEVLLAAYEKYGTGFINHIPGMFAFALWDETRQLLVMARDRFGEKPLYYARGKNGELVFASEIKAILATGLVDKAIDQRSLAHYLQFLTTPVGATIYKDIHELKPAHRLVWQAGHIDIDHYWSLPGPSGLMTLAEATEEFRSLFANAVRTQMVSDVEAGAFLSGGLDSTTVCLEAIRHNPGLQTISYGFAGGHSELGYARAVASRLGTNHHELEDDESVGATLVKMADVFDEPFADSSNVPMFRICQFARQHMKVVLSGDGADELLGGYDFWYKPAALLQQYPFLRYLPAASAKVPRVMKHIAGSGCRSSLDALARAISMNNKLDMVGSHYRQREYFPDDAIQRLMGVTSESRPPMTGDTLDDVLRSDIVDYMPADILRKVDRTAMANGLEVRSPFLDVDLASFLISLPVSLKVNSRQDKILLRNAYGSQWPEELRNRPKTGFGAPVTEWMKRDDIVEIMDAVLMNPAAKLYGLVDQAEVAAHVRMGGYRTWILLVLALWAEKNA